MSTSLKVVRIAAVVCASTRRLATVRRSGDIGTTRSRAPSSTVTGDGAGNDAGVGAGARVSTTASRCSRSSSARTTSWVEMRPPRPVPLTSDGAMPVSASIRRAEGGARNAPPSVGDAGATAAGAAVALAATAGRPFPFAGAAVAAATGAAAASRDTGSISAITSPTVTVSPALRRILRRIPAPGDGTSNVAFSLSTSTSGSSTLT